MKVVSANIDGIDRAINYGFFEWLAWQGADVVCLQELNVSALPGPLVTWLGQSGYDIRTAMPRAARKGAGVAILSRLGFDAIQEFSDSPLSERGQVVSATIAGVRVASVYVTYGNAEPERIEFGRIFETMMAESPMALLCGDFNPDSPDKIVEKTSKPVNVLSGMCLRAIRM